MINVDWETIKGFASTRSVAIQWVESGSEYILWAFDGPMYLMCRLPISDPASSDQEDFEENYQSAGNVSPKTQVVTQFEKDDKDLKICCDSGSVSAISGQATVLIPVPGDMASGEGRWVAGGTAFFSDAHAGDRILSVSITDEDNVLGGGAGAVVKSYTDLEQASGQQGWYIPPVRGQLEVEPVGGYGFLPAQLYLKIVAQKATLHYSGTFYTNIFWGKQSG